MLLAWLVLKEGWTIHQATTLRQATYAANDATAGRATETNLDLLKKAVRLRPDDAELRTELGDMYADLWRQHQDGSRLRNKASEGASYMLLVAVPGPGFAMPPILGNLLNTATMSIARNAFDRADDRYSSERYLAPALENYLQARDRGPLLPGPHLGLALHADHLAPADPASVYLKRVELLAPADPTFWYYCGNLNLRLGHPAEAWKSWRHCLELSDRFLPTILDRSAKFLSTEDLIREVVPEQPRLLREAAIRLYPRPDQARARRPFFQRALELLDSQPGPLAAKDLRMRALLFQGLERSDEAQRTFVEILQKEPLHADWRYEYAEILYQEGRLEEARGELATVLAQDPRHERAYLLWTKVMNDLVQKK